MATRSIIARVNAPMVQAFYCHWDGYPDHVGRILHSHYTADGETGTETRTLANVDAIKRFADKTGAEFVYLFDGSMWQCAVAGPRGPLTFEPVGSMIGATP